MEYFCAREQIVKRKHAFKNDGEECLCKFKLFWVDGPRKGEYTDVGCAEVCFLSTDAPEDDPMVKNLLKSLAGNGDQPRWKLVKSVAKRMRSSVPKTVPSPRPQTPSPSLELASSKKQSSKEPFPPTNQKVLGFGRTRSLTIGSKKKRIMRAELTDLVSDNEKVEMDGRQSSAPKALSRPRSVEGGGEATGHGDESDAPERRLVSGGSEDKERLVQKRRLVKKKAELVTPDVVDREEAAREEVMQDIPHRSFKERLKLNTGKKVPTPIGGAGRDKEVRQDMIMQSLGERVKLINTAKMAAPDPATAPPVVQSLGERVKLKTAKKSPAASPVKNHKVSLERTEKQVVGKQIMKRKLIQLEDFTPDPLSSKFDKIVKPRTPSKPKDVAAVLTNGSSEPANREPVQPIKVQKRKAGRPRKHPIDPIEPAKPAIMSATANKEQVAEVSSERMQAPQEEKVLDADGEICLSDLARKKRSRDEERSQHDSDNIVSDNTSQEDETRDAHARKLLVSGPATKGKKIIGDHDGVLPHDDTVPAKFARTNDMAEDHHHEDHSPLARNPDEAIETSCRVEKISMGERVRDIENKYRIRSSFSAPQAAQELVLLAEMEHYRANPTDQEHLRVSSPHDTSDFHPRDKADHETEANGKRRRVGKRQFVITDDEMEDTTMAPRAGKQELRGMRDGAQDEQDECSPGRHGTTSDAKNPSSALDEEIHTGLHEKHDGDTAVGASTRLLVLENVESGASAGDAMQVLQRHTDGVCAVHVLPASEFAVSATAFALYRDGGSALQALRWLNSPNRYVVSSTGRSVPSSLPSTSLAFVVSIL